MSIICKALKSIAIAPILENGTTGEFKTIWTDKHGFNQRKKLNRRQSLKFIKRI